MLDKLEERHPEWKGLKGNPGWKAGSAAFNQFNTRLKNLLYREGKWIHNQLNPKQPKVKETPEHDAPEDQITETPKQEKSTPMNTRHK